MEKFELSPASRKTKSIHFSTIISVALVLFMVGLFGLIVVYAKNLAAEIKENIVVNIIINDGVAQEDMLMLQKGIDNDSRVLKTEFISKEQAANILIKDLGDDFVKSLGYNPLLPSIDVYMKTNFVNQESVKAFSDSWMTKSALVKEVRYQPSLIEIVNQNIQKIELLILSFIILLLIISIGLINNTIRLTIYSQRFLIKSMQLVGATRGFIRKPFLKYSILHGLLSSLIAVSLLLLTLYVVQEEAPELNVLHDWTEMAFILAGILGIGILISVVSTFIAANKYLRLKIDELYR